MGWAGRACEGPVGDPDKFAGEAVHVGERAAWGMWRACLQKAASITTTSGNIKLSTDWGFECKCGLQPGMLCLGMVRGMRLRVKCL